MDSFNFRGFVCWVASFFNQKQIIDIQNKINRLFKLSLGGGMVDTKDLKSFARLERAGSTPALGTTSLDDYVLPSR